jgi:hypothetical protein
MKILRHVGHSDNPMLSCPERSASYIIPLAIGFVPSLRIDKESDVL